MLYLTWRISPLMGTLKPQSNGPLYSNTVIGTLAVDGWAVTFGTARRAWACCGPAQSPPRCRATVCIILDPLGSSKFSIVDFASTL